MTSASSKDLLVDTHFHVFAAGDACSGARYVPAYVAGFQAWSAAAC
jgi:predicted NAD/FAD-dependent oxidoreductase